MNREEAAIYLIQNPGEIVYLLNLPNDNNWKWKNGRLLQRIGSNNEWFQGYLFDRDDYEVLIEAKKSAPVKTFKEKRLEYYRQADKAEHWVTGDCNLILEEIHRIVDEKLIPREFELPAHQRDWSVVDVLVNLIRNPSDFTFAETKERVEFVLNHSRAGR